MHISADKISNIEEGQIRIEDALFFRLCHFLEATNEVSVFLEKLEETFRSGLSQARKESASLLAGHGFRFSDPDKYAHLERGKVLPFGHKRNSDSHLRST